jgi:uncharacterized membrane protein
VRSQSPAAPAPGRDEEQATRDKLALGLSGLLAAAGVAHFAVPDNFDSIVPRLLPGSSRFWTDVSGVAELLLAAGVAHPRTRRRAALASALFFVAVFPANIQMAVDYRTRPARDFTIALLRLPLQIPLVWWAWRVHRRRDRAGQTVSASTSTTGATN